jgi:uncharacterized protein
MSLLKLLVPLIGLLASLMVMACTGGAGERDRNVDSGSRWLAGDRGGDDKLFRRIKAAVDSVRMIDTHEHQVSEKFWLEIEYSLFSWFIQPWFPQYAGGDMISAGMPMKDLDRLRDPSMPMNERWELVSPWWPFARTTGFGQSVRLAARDIYGINEINDSTWAELNERIMAGHKPGHYRKVLHEMAGIDVIILDQNVRADPYIHSDFVKPEVRPRVALVKRFDDTFIRLTPDSLGMIEQDWGQRVDDLDELLSALDGQFDWMESTGVYVGVKCAMAYNRIVRYEDVSREQAEKIFYRIRGGEQVSETERRPFEDFMLNEVVRRTGKRGLVMQVHAGILAGGEANVHRTNVIHMNSLFARHSGTRFAVFHGSFPYMGELASIAKNFPNVYIDNCWMPIISPSQTKEWMHSWIETVPLNKLMGYGGDYNFPDGSYGHSLVARDILAQVLTEKVREGYFSEQEASWAAHRILRQNAVDLFGLERFLD